MKTSSLIAVVLLTALIISACDNSVDVSSPRAPVIVSITDSADVDEAVTLVAYIPGRQTDLEYFTLVIDWGDGRPHDSRMDVDAEFQHTTSHGYFDPGDYDIRCRAIDSEGRVSAWSEPRRVRIGGNAVAGKGDWWMFMRDAQHSGHSMFTGPDVPVLKYKYPLRSSIYTSAAYDKRGVMHFGYDGFQMIALYADHRWKWNYSTGTAQIRSSPMVLDDGTVYFGSNSANVYAIDRRGIKLWSTSVNAPVGFSSPAPLPGGGLVIGCTDGHIYAFDQSGNALWMIVTNGPVSGSPAVARDGTTYIGGEDQILYALDPSGGVRWTYPTEAPIKGSPSIAADGTIIFGNDAGWLYSIREDGKLNWKRNLRHPIQSTPAASRLGRIVCVTTNGELVSLDLDGVERWRVGYALTSSRSNAILDVNGTAYVGGPDGALSAFDSDGRPLWRYETDAPINTTPAIGQKGELVFGNDKGWLFVLGD